MHFIFEFRPYAEEDWDDWVFMGAIGYNAKLSAIVISIFQTTVLC